MRLIENCYRMGEEQTQTYQGIRAEGIVSKKPVIKLSFTEDKEMPKTITGNK